MKYWNSNTCNYEENNNVEVVASCKFRFGTISGQTQ